MSCSGPAYRATRRTMGGRGDIHLIDLTSFNSNLNSMLKAFSIFAKITFSKISSPLPPPDQGPSACAPKCLLPASRCYSTQAWFSAQEGKRRKSVIESRPGMWHSKFGLELLQRCPHGLNGPIGEMLRLDERMQAHFIVLLICRA